MTAGRAVRRASLVVHVVLATATLGLETAVLTLAAGQQWSAPLRDHGELRGLVVVLSATAALAFASGVVGTWLSPWRVLRTGWVVKKFVLTTLTTASTTGIAVASGRTDVPVWAAAVVTGLALAKSLLAVVLSVYKPGAGRRRTADRGAAPARVREVLRV